MNKSKQNKQKKSNNHKDYYENDTKINSFDYWEEENIFHLSFRSCEEIFIVSAKDNKILGTK